MSTRSSAAIAARDHYDSTRADSPLVEADGSIVVDTTGLSIDEVLDRIEQLLERRMTKISTRARRATPCSDRAAYQTVRFIVTVVLPHLVPHDRRGPRARAGRRAVHPGAHASQHPRHADRVGRHTRRMRFMGKDKYWKNKPFGRLLSALGGFPVTRGTADREALRRCIAVLEARRAAGAVPRGRAQERPDRAAAVRRCRPTSP